MARGVTEEQAHRAADAIVVSGERPTVERLRQHLGTGSAGTLAKWLDTWWQTLATRLVAHGRQMALPEAPQSVAALAGQLWQEALTRARDVAEAQLEEVRQTVEKERRALAEQQRRLEVLEQAAQSAAALAQTERDIALAQLAEGRQLIAQLQHQATDLVGQRDASQARVGRLEAEATALAHRVEELQVQARQARTAFESERRAFEDRAHQEVDLARQAVKALRSEMGAALKAAETSLAAANDTRDASVRETAQLRGEVAALRARAEALEEQLNAQRVAFAALPSPKSVAGPRRRGPQRAHPTKKDL